MAERDLLAKAHEALHKYSEETPCPICKRYGKELAQATKDLSEVHVEGERFVKRLAEKEALLKAREYGEKLKEEHGVKSGSGGSTSASLFDPETIAVFAPHNVLRLLIPVSEELTPQNLIKSIFGREKKRT